MKQNLFVVGFVLFAVALWGAAQAQGRPDGAGRDQNQRPTAGQQRDANAMRRQAEQRRLEAEARRAEAEAKSRAEQSRTEHPQNEHAADAAMAAAENADGEETASEMRARRDERKVIQEEYRDNREPGQEGIASDEASEDTAEEQNEKAKKSWWKFWDD